MKNDFLSWSKDHQNEFLSNAYLEIGDTYNIDTSVSKGFFSSKDNVGEDLVGLIMDDRYIHFTAKHLLGVNLFPYQMSILNTLWLKRLPMIIAARGGSKTTMLAVYCILRSILNQGVKIVIAGAGLRQSGLVFEAMEQIWKNAPILRDICGVNNPPKRSVLGYTWSIGSSKITGIPIGTGEKIRGLRANVIICDEFGSINPEIFETVIRGFASVQSHGTFDKVKLAYQKELLSSMNIDIEEEKDNSSGLSGNQIVIAGTSTYQFNHFYKYYKDYCDIIYSKGDLGEGKTIQAEDYAVIRIPYDHLPTGLMDKTILDQGSATMDSSIFKMEYGCVFAKDSEGFYPASAIYNATCPTLIGNKEFRFSCELSGEDGFDYVLGLDPASERDNLAISIIKVSNPRMHVYTWSTNRKKFEKDRKKNSADYKDIDDYNTFIIRKIHDLVNRFNIKRMHIDSGGGGMSILEGLKDKSKLGPNDSCIYDMDNEDLIGEQGKHIIKVIQFSKREWYESAHFNLLKDITTKSIIFPEYNSIEVEKNKMLNTSGSMMMDTFEEIQYQIEECKYQTTLVQEQTTAKGQKKWDIPKIKGVATEGIQSKLKKDHFTSILLANDAARELASEEEDQEINRSYVDTSSNIIMKRFDSNSPMYQGKGMKRMKKLPYNAAGRPRTTNNEGRNGSINY